MCCLSDYSVWNLFSQSYCFFYSGTSSPTGKFFGTCAVLSSHEDAPAWTEIYKFISSLGIKPKNHMGDGALALTKAGREVFGEVEHCYRLMCWSHVHRNIVPQLKGIAAHDKVLAQNILQDIENLQWSALNESSFKHVYALLEQKYINKQSPVINPIVSKFFDYMRSVWVESGEFRWYEGANPWHVSNNQGLEGTNKEIKQSHTFRRRLELGELFEVMKRLVSEWSEEDEVVLDGSRLDVLENDRNGLKMKTEGYQWYKQNNQKGKIMKINPSGKYSVSQADEFNLGKVDNLWSVLSSGDKSDKNLLERTKTRIQNRKVPCSKSFDEYLSIRSSCWIVEERDGDFFCDCPIGMKGKLCKHTVGLLYREGHIEVTSEVRSVPLGQKRRKGRPKKLPNCLMKSPVLQRNSQQEIVSDNDFEVENIDATTNENDNESDNDNDPALFTVEPTPPEISQVKKSTRRKRKLSETEVDTANSNSPIEVLQTQALSVGLGLSKPPKKVPRTGRTTGFAGSVSSACSASSSSSLSSSTTLVTRPPPVICKKRKGMCNHKVAFGKHYNEALFTKYAEYVKRLSPLTSIDE